MSREWRQFVAGARSWSIPTRVRHAESNGLLERMHRTHRHEGRFGTDPGSYELAVEAMSRFARFTNNDRPHSALHYLCPADVHYGDPEALRARREEGRRAAERARAVYWAAGSSILHGACAAVGSTTDAAGGRAP